MKFKELFENFDFYNDPGVKQRKKLGKIFLDEIEEIFRKDKFTFYKVIDEHTIKLTSDKKGVFEYARDVIKLNAQKHKYTYNFDNSVGELNVFSNGFIFGLITYTGI
jgi:hypothetical protein